MHGAGYILMRQLLIMKIIRDVEKVVIVDHNKSLYRSLQPNCVFIKEYLGRDQIELEIIHQIMDYENMTMCKLMHYLLMGWLLFRLYQLYNHHHYQHNPN